MRCLALCAAVAMVLCGPARSQTHTITNGGFEELGPSYFPRDWSAVGPGVEVTTEAHTGRYALRIHRQKQTPMPPETGLNRDWQPGQGKGGSMLDVLKGVVRVWYRVRSADSGAAMSVVVIPMGASGIEDTGQPRATRPIPSDVADNDWHEVKLVYDYTKAPEVKWVHIGIRIVGGAADLLVDDFELIQGETAILDVEKVHVYPDPASPDTRATLTACITNVGTAPSGPVRVVLELPAGLRAEGPASLERLAPSAATTVRWRLSGRLTTGVVRIHAEDGTERAQGRASLAPRVELESALAAPSLAAPGSRVTVTATLWNRGTAIAEGTDVVLEAPGERQPASARVRAIAPGKRASVVFSLRAPRRAGAEVRLLCRLIAPGSASLGQAWPVTIAATDALRAEPSLRIGPLILRTGSDRTVAHVAMNGRRVVPAGLMPHLGRVTFRLPSGGTQTLTARYRLPTKQRSPSGLEQSQVDRAGGRWTFRTVVQPLGANAARVRVSVACTAPRQIIAFEGPTVLAGEGAGGAAKSEAIFPGLEWLEGNEVSSSDLDIAPEHPDRLRYVPHPNKVTIPAMVVATSAATTALYWDARDKWDGTHDRVQPVFASPDRLSGRAAHLMGLMVPSSAHGWPENGVLDPKQPAITVKAGQRLTISAVVQIMPPTGTATAPGALAGVAGWFRYYRPEKPAPAPQGSDQGQIAWSMKAYESTLWDSAGGGWFPYLLGPAIWRKPSFNPSFAYDLLEASRILRDHPSTSAWQARLREVRQHAEPDTEQNLSFSEGDPLVALRGMSWTMSSLLGQQAPDGAFTFDADRRDTGVFVGYDYHQLGPPGAVELGIIARNAYLILRAARITGDRRLYDAGVRSLRRMASFRVPRAAQVWEVPVHTPDILAAADAVDAYVEAYRYSGDRKWLVEAKHWALAGLPFVYVWNAPGKLWMRYGSIPVFGASQYLGSWFGNLVQWNGLRHAAALLKLYPYDSETRWGGLSWRDIAIGITRSAMYQQSRKPEYLALWPDSLHTITGLRAAWEFAPRQILQNVFTWSGRSEEPATVQVPTSHGVVRITSPGAIANARLAGTSLEFRVQHPARSRGSVVIAGIRKPAAVEVGSRRIAERTERLSPDEASWRYDSALNAVAIRIPSDAPALVRVIGIEATEPRVLPQLASRLEFEFAETEEGWTPEHDVSELVAQGGVLRGVVSGNDPYIIRSLCRFEPDTVREIVLRIRADGGGGGQFYWTTSDSASFDEAKVLTFAFPPDGAWHEVVLPVGTHPMWRGKTITAIRLDPVNTAGVHFAVDYVRGR